VPPPPAPDPALAPPPGDQVAQRRWGAWLIGGPPRPGQLAPGWRLTVLATWVLAFLGWTAAWKASRELGLSTWWLGPSSEPRPFVIMLLPFVPVVAMIVLTVQNARRLPWYGLAASAVGAAIGAGDLGRVVRLGLVELGIAAATAAVSVASFSARYRRGSG
jgi:hypothetical protein